MMPIHEGSTPRGLPMAGDALPGCGGKWERPGDFLVREVPAYLPCGEGEHVLALVRKQGLTTAQAVGAMCHALGVQRRACGTAGLKDKHAITEQWVSLHGTTPEAVLGLELAGMEVLQAGWHRNKLKTGHLRGNRFEVVLRGVDPGAEERARAVMAALAGQGMPNYFGSQRFGRNGDNASQGLDLLLGRGRAPRDGRLRRLLFSALQSALFNVVLARRVRQGAVARLLEGDLLQRAGGRGLFVSEDPALDSARLAARELVVTGPLYGPRMPWPAQGGEARALEEAVLAEAELSVDLFRKAGRLARGGRRPLTVAVDQPEVEALTGEETPAVRLRFALPPGSYATVLLEAVTHGTGEARSDG